MMLLAVESVTSGQYPWMELLIGGLVAATNLVIAVATLVAVLRHERSVLADRQPVNGLYERALELAYLRGKSEGFEDARRQFEVIKPPPAGGNG